MQFKSFLITHAKFKKIKMFLNNVAIDILYINLLSLNVSLSTYLSVKFKVFVG